MSDFEKLVMIIGAGRSGTTLLQAMLNAHSRIAFLPDTLFVPKLVLPELAGERGFPTSYDLVTATLATETKITRLPMDVPDLVRRALASNVTNYRQLFEYILVEYAQHHKCPIVGAKDTLSTLRAAAMAACYPNAYIIHIVRDPRDVMLSSLKVQWGSRLSLLKHLFGYKQCMYSTSEPLFQAHPQRLEVRYEELITKPSRTLRAICDFLGEEYESGMSDYYRTSESLIASDEKSWKENVTKPLMQNNIGKWASELSQAQVLQIEACLYSEMKRLGFAVRSTGWIACGLSWPIAALFYLFQIKNRLR